MALISTSYAFAEAPLYRLYESVICKEHYRPHDPAVIGHDGAIPEEECKLDPIQQDLAMIVAKQVQINGWACEWSSNQKDHVLAFTNQSTIQLLWQVFTLLHSADCLGEGLSSS
jgi:hypothetical protein